MSVLRTLVNTVVYPIPWIYDPGVVRETNAEIHHEVSFAAQGDVGKELHIRMLAYDGLVDEMTQAAASNVA